MRLFTGIELSEQVSRNLERLLTHLRPVAHLRWSPVYNLHITTKFIGEWPEPRLGEITAALQSIAGRPPVTIGIGGLDWFPNSRNPRVFFAPVHGGPALADLACDVESALEPLGIAKDNRPYSPHLTLARINQPVPLDQLRQAIAAFESVDFGEFPADRIFLYRSKLGATGSVYTKLAEFPFSK